MARLLAAVLVVLILCVGLVILAGYKNPVAQHDTMAIIIGIVCGIAAGIPTWILLLIVMARRDQMRGGETDRYYPSVVVQDSVPMLYPITDRQFHVIGKEELGPKMLYGERTISHER